MKKALRTLSLFTLAVLVPSYAALPYRNNQSVLHRTVRAFKLHMAPLSPG